MPRKEPDMKRSMVWALPIAALFVLLADALAQAPAEPGPGGVQVIEVTAKKYVFEPSPIHVKAGTRVQLKITAIDHAHGFQIERVPEGADKKSAPGLVFAGGPECYKIEKQQTETVEFVAQTAGTYRFKCCTDCGFHHRSMKGELIVDP